MVQGSLSDVDSAVPNGTITAKREDGPRSQPAFEAGVGPRKSRQSLGSTMFKLLKRLWIPLVILMVAVVGGMTVSRLHGVFGSEDVVAYGDTRTDAAEPIDPKYIRYEVFGPPGTVAELSYFDDNGEPHHEVGVPLPWSLEFPIITAASIGSVAAQGDSDSLGCRILVDGVVKEEKIKTHEASTFAACVLKAA